MKTTQKRINKTLKKMVTADTDTFEDIVENRCANAGICGGCAGIFYDYEASAAQKLEKVQAAFLENDIEWDTPALYKSPVQFGYRNKMEYSFGNAQKGGELTLGLHKKRSYYDIISADCCAIAPAVFGKICTAVLTFCRENALTFYHKKSKDGYLRHLLLRTGQATNEILAGIVTTSQDACDWSRLVNALIDSTNGRLTGFVHIINDAASDVVKADKTVILYGRDYFYERILDLTFKVSLFSFFQTNSLGAQSLYTKVRQYVDLIGQKPELTLDLYCGTGTIAQIAARDSKKVIGIELSGEAVEAARQNAAANGVINCEFFAGDAFAILDGFSLKPDLIIMDPPRDGASPKALRKILEYRTDNIIYVSCKPESLKRDMVSFFHYGYRVKRMCAVDMFPFTEHVECVALMCRNKI